MEALVRDVIEQLKKTITFLEKLKVDKKQKPDRDNILKGLRSSIERCEETLSRNQGDGETYDDVGVNPSTDDCYDDLGERYDDLGTPSKLPPPPPSGDDMAIYDDTGEEAGQTYDDVGPSSMAAQTQQIATIECERLTNPTLADFLELKKEKSLLKSWQKKWCVIHSGILYIYDSPKDKKQKEAFRISGYTFKTRDDNKRKDRCFEIRNKEKVYEFCASDKDFRIKWGWALGGQKSGSMSDSLNGSTDGNYDDLGVEPPEGKKKKGFAFTKKKPAKTPVKPTQNGNADGEDIYEETDGNYDDTGKNYDDTGETYDDTGNLNYDDTGQTYDDTGITQEADDVYEETASPPQPPLPTQREKLLPPIGGISNRRPSHNDAPPPRPVTPKPPGFPSAPPALPARDETGSASGTYMRNRPPMPIPGTQVSSNRELPPPPDHETQRAPSPSFPPPPPVEEETQQNPDDDESLDVFGESKDDYINMYQGMWDCFADEDNELIFKRGEIIHIISKEYHEYGWWTAESRHQEIGLVPVSYIMKAFDI